MALHEELGPAHTSISAIAERAGVGRPTVYRHFPDDRALFTACTGHYLARHQPPDPAGLRHIADPEERLRFGLRETYRWYRETEQMMAVAFRDMPELPVLAEVLEPQFAWRDEAHVLLAEGWSAPTPEVLCGRHRARARLLYLALLARDHGLSDEIVADLLTALVVSTVRAEVPALA